MKKRFEATFKVGTEVLVRERRRRRDHGRGSSRNAKAEYQGDFTLLQVDADNSHSGCRSRSHELPKQAHPNVRESIMKSQFAEVRQHRFIQRTGPGLSTKTSCG